MQQGFKPESINDIEVGMKVLLRDPWLAGRLRGTVKYVGTIPVLFGNHLGVALDPDQGIMIIWVY